MANHALSCGFGVRIWIDKVKKKKISKMCNGVFVLFLFYENYHCLYVVRGHGIIYQLIIAFAIN